jgi:hypothetical protein
MIRVMTRMIRGSTRKRETYQIPNCHHRFCPSLSRCPYIGPPSSHWIPSQNTHAMPPSGLPRRATPSHLHQCAEQSGWRRARQQWSRASGAGLDGGGAEEAHQAAGLSNVECFNWVLVCACGI